MTEGTEGPALQQVEWPSWSHFLSFTDQLAEGISPQGGAFAFRGHADKTWKLEPSLTRIAKAAGLTTKSGITKRSERGESHLVINSLDLYQHTVERATAEIKNQ